MTAARHHLRELRCAEALAREAGRRIELGRRAGFTIDYKGRNDLVTNVDRETERFLREQLALLFPEDHVHGEEFGDGELPTQQSERVWLIDPIDGTTNFSQGIPIYCVSIALQVAGESVVGVIYDPTRDELFSASRGHGAWLDGVQLRVTEEADLARAIMATGFPPLRHGDTFEAIIERMCGVIGSSRGMRRLGSAALDLAYVAAGRLDGFWEFRLNAWDTAAGYLLVEEAGGKVTTAQGGDYDAHLPSIVATNGPIHQATLDALARAARQIS